MPDNRSAKSKKRRKTRQNKKHNKANDIVCSNITENDSKKCTEIYLEVSSSSVAPTEAVVSENVQVGAAEECDVEDNINAAMENDASMCEGVTLIKSNSAENNLNYSKSATIVELNEQAYNVESPERSLKKPTKKKLVHVPKSKSLDNDEDSQLNIVEITEHFEGDSNDEKSEKSTLVESNALISEAESDIEWEVADDLKNKVAIDRPTVRGTLSIETISLEQAECEHTQSLSPEEELSLRHYLQSLHLATSSESCPLESTAKEFETDIYVNNADKSSPKGRKKATVEEITRHAALKPRFLEVIDEEGSSESSMTTRRHSYLNEQQNEFDDLEDDVFIDNKQKVKQHTDNYPKSFVTNKNKSDKSNIHQECLLLDTKFIEPVIKEGCGDWKFETLERIDGAEVVYLDDSSSSTSDIYDIIEEGDEMQEFDENVQIRTPIIEMEAAGTVKPNFCDMGRCLKTPPPSPQVSFDVDDSNETYHFSESENETSVSVARNIQSKDQISQSQPNKVTCHKIELCISENNNGDKIVPSENLDNTGDKFNSTVLADVKPNSSLLTDDKTPAPSDLLPSFDKEKSISIPVDVQNCISTTQVDDTNIPVTLVNKNCNTISTSVEERNIPITLINHNSDFTTIAAGEKNKLIIPIQDESKTDALVNEKSNSISLPVRDKSVSTVHIDSKSSSNLKCNSTVSVRKQINSTVMVHEKSNRAALVDERCEKTSTAEEKNIPIILQSTNLQSINQQTSPNVQVDEKMHSTIIMDEKYKTVSMPVKEKIIPITLVDQTCSTNLKIDKDIPTVVVEEKLRTNSKPVENKIIPITLVDQESGSNVEVDEKIIPIIVVDEKLKITPKPVENKIIPIRMVDEKSNSNVDVEEKMISTVLVEDQIKAASKSVEKKIIPITLVDQKSSSNIQVDENIIPIVIMDEKVKTTSVPVREKIIPITLVSQKSTPNLQIDETIIPITVVDKTYKMSSTPIEEKIIPITLVDQKSSSNIQIDNKVISSVPKDEKYKTSSKLVENKFIHKSEPTVPCDKKIIPSVLLQNKINKEAVIDEKYISTSRSCEEKLVDHKFFSTASAGEKIIPVQFDHVKLNRNMLTDETPNSNSKSIQQKPNITALDNEKLGLTVLSGEVTDSIVQNKSNMNEQIKKKSNSVSSAELKEKPSSDINSLKDELNAALLNLMQQVTEDSNESTDNTYSRQDSSSSLASSQSTARYNPNTSSLTDIATILHDDLSNNEVKIIPDGSKSHVKEVIECITDSMPIVTIHDPVLKQPSTLKEICVSKIAELPYGKAILEELANLSESLKEVITVNSSIFKDINTYPKILDKMMVQTKERSDYSLLSSKDYRPLNYTKIPPPPVAPRNSSLKITTEDVLKNKSNAVSSSFGLKTDKTTRLHDTNDVNRKNVGHNTYRMATTYLESKKNDITKSTNTSTSPFKSQTGNRLLAIIQDPSINANLTQFRTSNIPTQDHKLNSSTPSLNVKKENIYNFSTNHIKKHIENDIHKTYTHSEVPIPPPRTKKYKATSYESDDSSEMTDSSYYTRSERKHFYSSLGNINEDFESSTSASHLQYLYKKSSRAKDHVDHFSDSTYSDIESNVPRRRLSLPRDICDQQMEYIVSKEKQIEDDIKRLETSRDRIKGPRAPLLSEKQYQEENMFDTKKFHISRRGDFAVFPESGPTLNERPRPAHLTSSQEELFREKMYTEYMNKFAERAERKQHKIIKISSTPQLADFRHNSQSLPILNHNLNQEIKKTCNKIEEEFISKAKQRWDKIGFKDPETDDEKEKAKPPNKPTVLEHKIKVIEEGKERDMTRLPNHLREFVQFTAGDKDPATSSPAIWSPGSGVRAASPPPGTPPAPPPPPVWAPPASPPAPRKPYRPVAFSSPTLQRRSQAAAAEETPAEVLTPPPTNGTSPLAASPASAPPSSPGAAPTAPRLPSSQSAPAAGLQALAGSRLPRAQNPTITLLQKAREGQIPRGPTYIWEAPQRGRSDARNSPPRYEPAYTLKKEYQSEPENEGERPRKMAELGPKKVEGIGPTTKEGMPVALRSEVKDPSRWYKKMYDTIHKSKNDDEYVTVRYKSRRGQPSIHRTAPNRSQYAYFDPRSGYLSEPEPGTGGNWSDAYDSDVTTGMANRRRRTASVQDGANTDGETSSYLPSNKYSTLASARASQEVYKNQPGKIEDYMPGRSSVVDKEAKQQLSSTTSLHQTPTKEKKELTSAILSKSNMARALKESGYESDSTLVFRRREVDEAPLSPLERRQAYRSLQAGGEPPLHGFRSPAPERPRESPRRYVESDVNIHYRCPVRQEPRPLVPEHELARRQAEHMRRVYQEERRRKYLQDDLSYLDAFDQSIKELQDMQSRRHTDNFTPSQKTAVLLNRYDDLDGVAQHKPKVMARALYAFTSQSPRELGFRKGDLITVRRQVDANWYEGELNGKVGLFPYNYIEITKGEAQAAPKKSPVEGRARAKFDFTAQTTLELPLKRGELVVLTRRIDQNWWEGRLGSKTGIFPDSYVQVLAEPSPNRGEVVGTVRTDKPVASPASHGLLNGSAKHSMGAHSYTPQLNSAALSNAPPATQPLPNQYVANYHAKPAHATLTPSERGYGPPSTPGIDLNNSQPLYIDTNAEAVPYRAMYKYRPQNPDELELMEGDTVYVLEKCDDGWYVGSSQRTGKFGTFPGNYVERI